MEKIKLVVWDLDETFWKGTLSEGEVTIIPDNVEIVKELVRRGIMNSISSKNDYEQAKIKLQEAGVWDYFIFPSIAWTPKGQNVQALIKDCQLRAPNVLFIDDNHGNRNEVEHYNSGINTSSEEIIPQLLGMDELKGKDDNTLSRLNQYKLLEKKHEVEAKYVDNREFLRDSQIKLTIIKDIKDYRERIYELINRTNQLNFTKVRLNEDDFNSLIEDKDEEKTCVHVKDRFGDYGICGFYSLNKNTNKLTHFLFSCRILNMGIESYIYQKLGCPDINIVGPVSGVINSKEVIDWVSEEDSIKDLNTLNRKKSDNITKRIRVLLLGGCDLEQVCHYIDHNSFEVIKEFNYPNKKGIPVHKEHTVFLKAMANCKPSELEEIYSLPFGDSHMFDSILWTAQYDVLVYSTLMNYTQDVFQRKNGDYQVAFGGYTASINDSLERMQINEDEKVWFTSNYQYLGQQSIDSFKNDLKWLITSINKPIIFINGAEVDNVSEKENNAANRHRAMNTALDEVISLYPNRCKLLDMRGIVTRREQNTNNLRHYIRPVYVQMAETLMTLLKGERVKVRQAKKLSKYINDYYKKMVHKINQLDHIIFGLWK